MSQDRAKDQDRPKPMATVRDREGVLVRRVVGPMMRRAGIAAIVEVLGRTTGAPHRVTVVPQQVDGTWYLLSTYGNSGWVRNVRAAGQCTMRHRGRTQSFIAIEVDPGERDRIERLFRARAPKPFQRDFDLRSDPADHPAFRLVPADPDTAAPAGDGRR